MTYLLIGEHKSNCLYRKRRFNSLYLSKRKNIWKKYKNINQKNFQVRNSARYKEWRKQVLERDEHKCQLCGCTHKRLVVHHIKGFEKYPALRFELDNGITLCFGCHYKFHEKFGKEFFPDIRLTDFFKSGNNNNTIILKEVVNE